MKKILTLLFTTTVISVGMMDMARACKVLSYGALSCGRRLYGGDWQCDTATATCTDSSSDSTVSYDSSTGNETVYRYGSTTTTYDATTGKKTSYTVTNSNGNQKTTTYDANGKITGTSYTEIDPKGNHKTTTYDANGNRTGISYTDSAGNNLTGVIKDGNYTYNVSDGTMTDYRYDYSSNCYRTGPDGNCQKGGYAYIYDATGNITSSTQIDPDGNQKVTANGQTTYLDSDGNALTGTFKDGRYTYNSDDGTLTSSDYEISCYRQYNGVCYASKEHTEYDENGRKTVSSYNNDCSWIVNGACEENSHETKYEYDENGKQSYIKCGTSGDSKYCTFYDGNTNTFGSCNINSSGLCNSVTDYNRDGVIAYILDPEGLYVKAKTICASGKTDCTTEVYDSEGNVIAEYADNGKPVNAYDYADDGSALVYDDQCRVKERLDPYGNSIYGFGDTLLSDNRRTRYTPAEAAEIVGNSEDNMIVMYFK